VDGLVELDAGLEAVPDFVDSSISSALLASAVTGGASTETDASLVARARFNTADAGVGSYYGLCKRLASAPVEVLDLGVVSGESSLLYRARYNTVNINPGGFVDCYVKTQRQASTVTLYGLQATRNQDSSYTASLSVSNAPQVAGFFTVTEIYAGESELPVDSWSISYGRNTEGTSEEGARLGVNQAATVTFQVPDSYSASISFAATFVYMPGIKVLQEFIDSDINRFVGQDVKIKAAVPVSLRLRCMAKCSRVLSETDLGLLRSAMSNRVSDYKVGTKVLNFSDLRETCATAVPDVDLRLPCSIVATILTKNGVYDTFCSSSGLLDISNVANHDYWESEICFFTLNPDNIDIKQL
jgi:hypothetical protein